MSDFSAEIRKQEYSYDPSAEASSREKWDRIAKPLHGLGRFENIIARIAGAQGTADVRIDKRALCVFCADNGVVEEGVTQTGQEVTAQVAENFARDRATAALFCREAGVDLYPVDIGMARETSVPDYRIAAGTRNFAKEPAMTRDEAVRAIGVGMDLAGDFAKDGYQILAAGEMGIGNTTTSSAIASVLLSKPVAEMTGRGAGLDSARLARKIEVIEEAIRLHKPDPEDPVDVLAKVGGFDIAGITGLMLGAAKEGIPVVIDGFIAGVSALLATRLSPGCADYLLASHISKEPAAQAVLDALNKEAVICADMMLGEGSGALMLFPLLDMALAVYRKMPTFEQIDVEAYVPLT